MPLPETIPNKRILGKRVLIFRGCAGCPKRDSHCQQSLTTSSIRLRHSGNERWDNWGHIVSVFRPNEWVEVQLIHDTNYIYCSTAESSIYPGSSDYVDLNNFSQEEAT